MSNDNGDNRREQNARIAAAAGLGAIQMARNYALRRAGAGEAQAGLLSLGSNLMRARSIGTMLTAGIAGTLVYAAVSRSTGGFGALLDRTRDEYNGRNQQ